MKRGRPKKYDGPCIDQPCDRPVRTKGRCVTHHNAHYYREQNRYRFGGHEGLVKVRVAGWGVVL